MLVLKTPKNPLTVRKQTTGLQTSKWSAQVTISKDGHGAARQAPCMYGQTPNKKCVKGGRVIWLLSGGDAVQHVEKERRQEGLAILVGL